MKYLIILLTSLIMVGCTQTMTMVHTQGLADDVVDETSSSTPTISPNISPVISIPSSASALL